MDLTKKPVASAQNYEEIKEELNDSDSEASTEVMNTTKQSQQSSQMDMVDDFDKQFFRKNVPKIKLNKGEKRALKFAMKKGVDPSQVDDLRLFLATEMKQ